MHGTLFGGGTILKEIDGNNSGILYADQRQDFSQSKHMEAGGMSDDQVAGSQKKIQNAKHQLGIHDVAKSCGGKSCKRSNKSSDTENSRNINAPLLRQHIVELGMHLPAEYHQ